MENKLITLYSIGNAYAKIIIRKLLDAGLITEADLEKNITIEELRKLLKNKAIFSQLPLATQTDLLYNPLRIMPRSLIDKINTELKKLLKIKFDIAGSYRRKKPMSRDIDLLVSIGKYKDKTWEYIYTTVNKYSKLIKILPPFARGNDKVTTLFKIKNNSKTVYIKVDTFLVHPEEYIFSLLYGTGSGNFNLRMRALAKKRGYLLNQRGLFKKENGKLIKVPVKNEKEIFRILNMHYKKPEERSE